MVKGFCFNCKKKKKQLMMNLSCRNFFLFLPYNILMKLIAFILSFYLFYLTIIPCDDCEMVANGNFSELSSQKHTNNHQETSDHCSPLCVCSCCTTVAEVSIILHTIVNYSVCSIIKFPYHIQTVSAFISNIWQPPKIS
jgi:hypothetical protein